MRTRNFIFFILLTAVMLCSCKTRQLLVQSTSTDSTIVNEKYIERPVIVPGDSVKISVPILIQDNKPVPQKLAARSSRARVELEITPQGMIEVQANCDEYQAKVMVLERSVSSYRHDIEVYKEKESRLQKTINDIYRGIKRAGILIGILATLIVALKYAKPILLIIKSLFKWQKNSI